MTSRTKALKIVDRGFIIKMEFINTYLTNRCSNLQASTMDLGTEPFAFPFG